jgi:hypothetical protein
VVVEAEEATTVVEPAPGALNVTPVVEEVAAAVDHQLVNAKESVASSGARHLELDFSRANARVTM